MAMNTRLSISAVFPCYNDAGTIPSMVLRVMLVLRELTDDYEVSSPTTAARTTPSSSWTSWLGSIRGSQ